LTSRTNFTLTPFAQNIAEDLARTCVSSLQGRIQIVDEEGRYFPS
jgi:hypothetical protein